MATERAPSYTTGKLVQRAGYYAIQDPAGGWAYYPMPMEEMISRNGVIPINKYDGPIKDGVAIRKGGVAYLVTEKNLRKMHIPMVSRRCLVDLQTLYDAEVVSAPEIAQQATPEQEMLVVPSRDPVLRRGPVAMETATPPIRPMAGAAQTTEATDLTSALARLRAQFPELNP